MLKKVFLLNLMVLFFCISSIFSQEEANCGIYGYGWLIDKDPKGTNVRNQPSIKGKVIANLPHKSNDDDDIVTIYITGYSNGWVKIARAETISGSTIFDDIGWISAKMVETGTKGSEKYNSPANLYAQADSKKKIGSIPSEVNVKIAGFSCGWIKVSYKGKTGWIRTTNICGNPVTTCA